MTSHLETVQVVFTPSGKRGEIVIGKSVLEAAQQLSVDLDTICGGNGICDRCQIDQSVGRFLKFGINSKVEHLSHLSSIEKDFFKNNELSTRRLGCQAKILGNVVIDVPPESQVHRQVVRKGVQIHNITLNPSVCLYYIEVPEPNMHEPSGDLQRMLDALEFEWGIMGVTYDFNILSTLQSVLRKGHWKVTVAVNDKKIITAVWPGLKSNIYGLSIDVGSTTIAAQLVDLVNGEIVASIGRMNPQIKFGEDLMSRVSYAMMNKDGDIEMTQEIRYALQELIEDLTKQSKVEISDLLDITLVGNPVMHHLLLGINPIELGGAPFALATDQSINVRSSDLSLSINPVCSVYLLPCIAGHVGADAAAATLAAAPYKRQELTLVVDVGTNAELVLGNSKKMVAASSPTGPAFEGAQISGGQRAAVGAIERVRINKKTFEPKFKIIGSDLWSDHSQFIESTKGIGITGICGSGIIEVIAEMFLAKLICSDGMIDGSFSSKTARLVSNGKTWSYELYNKGNVKIMITQDDVRAIQLAKAALFAGARLLMDKLKVDAVDRIQLAGAFGTHIDVKYAMILGMIPDCDLNHVQCIGNAAGTGAMIALLDVHSRDEIENVVKRIQKVETAVEPKFQDYFIQALAIPHKTEKFINLEKVVHLPQPKEDKSKKLRRRRRPE